MNSKYKIIKNQDKDNIYIYELYCNGELIKGYIDEKSAENIKEKLEEVDKLKESEPNLGLLNVLENFIKSL